MWGDLRGLLLCWCRQLRQFPSEGLRVCARQETPLYITNLQTQVRDIFSRSPDAFTPTQAPARKRKK